LLALTCPETTYRCQSYYPTYQFPQPQISHPLSGCTARHIIYLPLPYNRKSGNKITPIPCLAIYRRQPSY